MAVSQYFWIIICIFRTTFWIFNPFYSE